MTAEYFTEEERQDFSRRLELIAEKKKEIKKLQKILDEQLELAKEMCSRK